MLIEAYQEKVAREIGESIFSCKWNIQPPGKYHDLRVYWK